MWMHEHFNLPEAPDLVTFSKKMLSGGIYHKVCALRSRDLMDKTIDDTFMGDCPPSSKITPSPHPLKCE